MLSSKRGLNLSCILKGRTEKKKDKGWVDARERQEVSNGKVESGLACEGQRKETAIGSRAAVALVKSEAEDMGRMMTLISQEVQEIFFSDLFSSRKHVVSWEGILTENLRKGFYPILFTPLWLKFWKSRTGNKYV